MKAIMLAALAAGALVIGCESEVTRQGRPYQPDEDAGGGGTNRPGTTATATREDLAVACNDFCLGGQPDCDIWDGFCETECESIFFEGCEAPAVALIECLMGLPPDICRMWDSPCEVELAELVDCMPRDACERGATITSIGECSVSGICGGTVMNQDCYATGESTYECRCYRGSDLLKTCEDQQILSCDINACCGQVAL